MAEPRADVVFVVTAGISTMFIDPIAARLAAHGARVVVIANFDDGLARVGGSSAVVEFRSLPFRRRPSPVHDVVHLFRLVSLIRRLRPRVVHASTPKGGLLGVLAGRIARCPAVIYQARGLRSENTGGIGGRVQRRLERTCTSMAHHVIVNSQSLRRAMIEARVLRADAGIVIGSGGSVGVDTSRFSPASDDSPQSGPFTVGYVGRIHPDKGIDALAEAFTAVRSVRPDARLLLVGDVDDAGRTGTGQLSGIASPETTADAGIEITGFVDDVVPHLRRMDVMVFPSSREGLPNAPLEAQACCVPVVAYRVTGVVDAVADGVGGVLVEAGDRPALADAVVGLALDEGRRRRLGTGGREFVREHFERAVVVGRNADFIGSLLGATAR